MSDTHPPHPPGWYPDPMGRHEHRWFDGSTWTPHVSSGGAQGVDAMAPPSPTPTSDLSAADIAHQVQNQAGAAAGWAGDGTLFGEPILVVNQKAKIIELENEYAICDQHGRQIGAVRQVGQSSAKKLVRAFTNLDQYMTHTLQIVDAHHQVVLQVTRPSKVFKSTFSITTGTGHEVGRVVQQNMVGKIRFGLESGGQQVGAINAENWRAWDFHVADHTGVEVARITKTWAGLTQAVFTTADRYVVQIHRPLTEPLRSLVVAAALSIDTALKQDARGFN